MGPCALITIISFDSISQLHGVPKEKQLMLLLVRAPDARTLSIIFSFSVFVVTSGVTKFHAKVSHGKRLIVEL